MKESYYTLREKHPDGTYRSLVTDEGESFELVCDTPEEVLANYSCEFESLGSQETIAAHLPNLHGGSVLAVVKVEIEELSTHEFDTVYKDAEYWPR